MTSERTVCWITGRLVTSNRRENRVTRFLHGPDPSIGWAGKGEIWWSPSVKPQNDGTVLNYDETELLSADDWSKTKYLIRSKFWRLMAFGGGGPYGLFITSRATRQHDEEANGDAFRFGGGTFRFVSLEDVAEEAKALTLTDKAARTLVNLYEMWRKTGAVNLDYLWKIGVWIQGSPDAKEPGVTYGCDEREAPIVYSLLRDRGFLHKGRPELTPDGFVRAEELLRAADPGLKQGFFVRRYDEDLDEFFKPIIERVASTTGCEIRAVWERPKNEKLDELILRRIREATVVVADVTGERFNVGLELGYAMALRKQIVLLCEKKNDRDELPFDIRTMHCYFYERSDVEGLQHKLIERVKDALEDARVQTPIVIQGSL
ncbi:MAG: hypothetical protein AB1725_00410 [Armatimonadota bacterium]